jgi:hypothetical protein
MKLKVTNRLCDLLATHQEVPGSIPSTSTFSEQWVWEQGPFSLVRITEELLEWKVAAPV